MMFKIGKLVFTNNLQFVHVNLEPKQYVCFALSLHNPLSPLNYPFYLQIFSTKLNLYCHAKDEVTLQ